jgi:hypothetical protein
LIYVEGKPNPDVLGTLLHAPGIMTKWTDVIHKFVPPEAREETLHLPKEKELKFAVGQWVRVSQKKDVYKGDLGYIKQLHHWGGVRLLLVPRLRLPVGHEEQKRNKRPRSIPPPDRALFDPSVITKVYGVPPVKEGESYYFNGSTFEHGLLVKDLDTSSVSSEHVFISAELRSLFLHSPHPAIQSASLHQRFPSPLEWSFFPGEPVQITKGPHEGERAQVQLVQSGSLSLELSSSEIVILPWYAVQKWLVDGSLVKVVGGVHAGRTGIIESVIHSNIRVVDKKGDESNPIIEVTPFNLQQINHH